MVARYDSRARHRHRNPRPAVSVRRRTDALMAAPKVGMNRGNAGKGRPKGARNKATADVKALASKYGPDAIKELARLATQAESEAARVTAIKELLDRGYGKSVQAVEHSGPDGGPVKHAHEISDEALARIATGGR